MAIVESNGVSGKVCLTPECGWKPLSEFGPVRSKGKPVGDGYRSRCRRCMAARKRELRAADPERYRAKASEYVAKNREHIRELKRAHQRRNREKYRDAYTRFRVQHRELVNLRARQLRAHRLEHARAIGRASYARHREVRLAASKDYLRRNRSYATHLTNMRRARKKAADGTHTLQQWNALKLKYGSRCLACGRHEAEIRLTRDHVIPLVLGGSDSVDNLQPLCARCNSSKGTKVIDYRPKSRDSG